MSGPTGGHSDRSDVDAVRAATDLVALVGEHIALQRRGREFVGLCPFHDDRSPSLCVVPHKGFYKCFACGATGDCLTFAMQHLRMTFPEALEFLARRAGIVLQRRRDGDEARADERRRLVAACAFARDWFRSNLADPAVGATARAEIQRRGIDDDTAARFELGCAPDSFDAFLAHLQARRGSEEIAEAAGLLKTRPSGGRYDAFRNRLVFPIHDERGRPIAFGARILSSDDRPKYLNSPETPIFHKSRVLFGLHLARRAIVAARTAIVAEGYTDVIACHRAGFDNVVATLGTALTDEHAAVLERLAERVVLLFDGDEAGRKAADRAVEVLLPRTLDVAICMLPDGLDPDDLLRTADGPARFQAALDASRDPLDFVFDRFRGRFAAETGDAARQRTVEHFLEELDRLGLGRTDGLRRTMMLNRVARLVQVPATQLEDLLRRRAGARAPAARAAIEARPDAPTAETAAVATTRRARLMAEQAFVSILLFHPPVVRHLDEPPLLVDPVAAEVLAAALHVAEERDDLDAVRTPDLLARLSGEPAREKASRLYFEGVRRCGDDEMAAREQLRLTLDELEQVTRNEDYHRTVEQMRAEAREHGREDALLAVLRARRAQGVVPSALPRGRRNH